MPKFTKEQILKKFEDMIEDAYWNEDRDIDRSNCCDRSYYVERRKENDKTQEENRSYLLALEELLEEKWA
jgi:hypothetical protein